MARLHGNRLERLPATIASLDRLAFLHLDENALQALPRSLGGVTSLEVAARRLAKGGLFVKGNPVSFEIQQFSALRQPDATLSILAALRGELDDLPLFSSKADNAPPPTPKNEAGPEFEIRDDRIELRVLPDYQPYDEVTQALLHERLLDRTEVLLNDCDKTSNQHPELRKIVEDYLVALSPPTSALNVVELWVYGISLLSAAEAFASQKRQSDLLTTPLEPGHLALLTETARLHGGFVLGFPLGRELTERSDRALLSPEIAQSIEEPTRSVLEASAKAGSLIADRARSLIRSVEISFSQTSWKGARGTYNAYAVARNLIITMGRSILAINAKGGALAGAIAPLVITPELMAQMSIFIGMNAPQILAFAMPFQELKVWVDWIINALNEDKTDNK